MPRLVLDTNVLVSALLTQGGNPARVLEGVLEGRWELLVSPEIADEYESVLARPRLGLSRRDVRETIARLRQVAAVIHPQEAVEACRDPADDKFLACCLAGGATHLITGNIRHFLGSPFMGLQIVSPAQFLLSPE